MTDYISREAAFKEFIEFVRDSNNSDFVDAPTWNDAVSLIGSLPAADVVEVVHGEWLPHVNPMNDDDWACSNCGRYFFFEAGDPIANGTYYCPYCGAKMDGGAEP